MTQPRIALFLLTIGTALTYFSTGGPMTVAGAVMVLAGGLLILARKDEKDETK